MSCGCENKMLGKDLERIRRLAKIWAKGENETVVIYLNDDGTYGFAPMSAEIKKPIKEYITAY